MVVGVAVEPLVEMFGDRLPAESVEAVGVRHEQRFAGAAEVVDLDLDAVR